MSDFSSFRAVYDELTSEVSRSRYTFLRDHLANWFQHLDGTPGVAVHVRRLEDGLDFNGWYQGVSDGFYRNMEEPQRSFPKEREKALGMKVLLFRAISDGQLEAFDVAHMFVSTGSDLDEAAHGLTDQMFMPMSNELRRLLEREAANVPASDRVVPLNHNQPEYKEVIAALERLERALTEANDYPDAEDKEQKIAEVSAARRLFKAPRISIEALRGVLLKSLTFLTKTFASTGVGMAAKWAFTKWASLYHTYGSEFEVPSAG